MPKGPSGRVVIELDPELKDELYFALDKEGLKMKQWFIESAQDFLSNRSQLKLQFVKKDKEAAKTRGAL